MFLLHIIAHHTTQLHTTYTLYKMMMSIIIIIIIWKEEEESGRKYRTTFNLFTIYYETFKRYISNTLHTTLHYTHICIKYINSFSSQMFILCIYVCVLCIIIVHTYMYCIWVCNM